MPPLRAEDGRSATRGLARASHHTETGPAAAQPGVGSPRPGPTPKSTAPLSRAPFWCSDTGGGGGDTGWSAPRTRRDHQGDLSRVGTASLWHTGWPEGLQGSGGQPLGPHRSTLLGLSPCTASAQGCRARTHTHTCSAQQRQLDLRAGASAGLLGGCGNDQLKSCSLRAHSLVGGQCPHRKGLRSGEALCIVGPGFVRKVLEDG